MKYVGSFVLLAVVFASSTAFAQGDGKNRDGKKGRQRPGQSGFSPERILKALDKNGDGKLAQSEAPERMKERFAQMDANSDGFVDAAEMKKAIEMRARRGGQPGKAGGSASGKKGNPKASDSPRPDFAAGRSGRGFDLAAMFKQGDKDGDGNLNPKEQAAIVEKFNALMAKMRQMRGGDAAKKGKTSDRFKRPDTDPVKPKRPGMDD